MNVKAERINSKNIYYVLVTLNELDQPDYYIVPSAVVANRVAASHAAYLAKPSKSGQPHKDSTMRKFKLDQSELELYKNNWIFK